MLSLLAFPKPFRSHIATIQRNAIGSWMELYPDCDIILFGDEEGTADVAKEFGLRHVPDMTRNEFGTPLLSAVFEKGERLATHSLVCYVNCDIILGSDFIPAVKKVCEWKQRFLMVGECWNLDVPDPLPFECPSWEENLKARLQQRGQLRGQRAIDYFVFPRGLYGQLPPFALGRAWFDNWLIWKVRDLKAAVVDVSRVVTVVHQNHDYGHVQGGKMYTQRGVEATRNLELAGGSRHCLTIGEATHRLLQEGIRRNWGGYIGWQTKQRVRTIFWRAVDRTRPLRHALGLRLGTARRLRALVTRTR